MEKKITVVINKAYKKGWIPYNGITHISLALGQHLPSDWFGKHPLKTRDGKSFAGIIKYPVVVKEAKPQMIRKVARKAILDPDIKLVCFTQEMLETGPDSELVEAMEKTDSDDLIFTAIIVAGTKKRIDNITGNLSLLSGW